MTLLMINTLQISAAGKKRNTSIKAREATASLAI